MTVETITIVGQGKVGSSLADAIELAGNRKLAGFFSAQEPEFEIDSEVVIIAAKDDAVASVSRKVMDSASERLELLVQTAGSVLPSSLAMRQGVSVLTLHPIQTISKPDPYIFRGIYWMACSEDPKAIQWAETFIANLGGIGLLVLEERMLPLYHAMTVFSSNFITLLLAMVEEMAESLELEPQAIKQALTILSENALENALQNPARSVLTGPFARKDFLTIRKHQQVLAAVDPKLNMVYEAFWIFAQNKKLRKSPGTAKR